MTLNGIVLAKNLDYIVTGNVVTLSAATVYEDIITVITDPDLLNEVREHLSVKFGDPKLVKLSWNAQNNIESQA